MEHINSMTKCVNITWLRDCFDQSPSCDNVKVVRHWPIAQSVELKYIFKIIRLKNTESRGWPVGLRLFYSDITSDNLYSQKYNRLSL